MGAEAADAEVKPSAAAAIKTANARRISKLRAEESPGCLILAVRIRFYSFSSTAQQLFRACEIRALLCTRLIIAEDRS